ncbi:MAG TPA: alpha/beta fold hydrolase [Symbiobacteriaceae bacterium]
MATDRFKFSSRITHTDYVVRDHQLHNARTLPGVTYLDLIYRYLNTKGIDTRQVALKNLVFKEPILVDDTCDRKLSIALDPSPEGWLAAGTSQRLKDGMVLDAPPADNFHGEVREAAGLPARRLDIESLQRNAIRVVDMDQIYVHSRNAGLVHYDFMKLQGVIYVGNDYVLAHAHLSELAREYLSQFYLHPAFLDGALSVPAVLLLRDVAGHHPEAKPFIPLYIDSFHAVESIRDNCFIYVNEANVQVAPSQDITYSDIEIYNPDGNLAVFYHRFGAKKVRSQDAVRQGTVSPWPQVRVQPPKSAPALVRSVESELVELVAAMTGKGPEEIAVDKDFYSLGLESTHLLDLVAKLEQKLNTKFYPTLLFEHNNIRDLARYLETEHGQAYRAQQPAAPGQPQPVAPQPRPMVQASPAALAKPVGGAIESDLRTVVAGLLGKDPQAINIDADFYSHGLDSGDLLKMVGDLEAKLQRKLYPTLLFEYPTIRTLAGYLQEECGTEYPAAPPAAQMPPVHDFYYRPRWEQQPRSAQAQPGGHNGLVLLVYPAATAGLAEAIACTVAPAQITTVVLGSESRQLAEHRWEIQIGDAAAIAACLENVGVIDTIYFLGISPENPAESPEVLDQSQEAGVITLFRLVKALSASKRLQTVQELKVVTNNVHQIEAGEQTLPYAGSLVGFVKSLAKEYPRMGIACVDVDLREALTGEAVASAIVAEPPQKRGEEVAIRKGSRFVRAMDRMQLLPAPSTPFRRHGVYLIVGGAGGIGLELSMHLAEQVQARLVLIGRKPLNPAQQQKIAAIESKGGRVLYLQADATDPESMRRAVTEARRTFGQINGAIHSAIVLRDQMIEGMSEATLRDVLAPKVKGSLALFQALGQEPLDFLMFFSSAQSFIGNIGQSNYAAACTFKDAYATYLRQRVSYPVLIINWGYWGTVGVAATTAYNDKIQSGGVGSILPEEGMQVVEAILHHRIDQVMPIKLDARVLAAAGMDTSRVVEVPPMPVAATTTAELAPAVARDTGVEYHKTGSVPAPSGSGFTLMDVSDSVPFDSFSDYWKNKSAQANLDVAKQYYLLASRTQKKMFRMMVEASPGERLEVIVAGNGRPILLISGFGLTAPQWYHQFKEWYSEYQVIVIHAPGHGFSAGSRDFSVAGIGRTFMNVLSLMEVEWPIHVVGSSWGGMVAQAMASQFPERIASLTLVCSFSDFTDSEPDVPLKEKVIRDLANLPDKLISDMVLGTDLVLNSEFINADAKYYQPDGFSTQLLLPYISAPTLVIAGSHDLVVGADEVKKVSEGIATARYVEIVGAGHIPNVTHVETFNQQVLSFIREHDEQVRLSHAPAGRRSKVRKG